MNHRLLSRTLLLVLLMSCSVNASVDHWAASPDRPWAGPSFWANRLQDWQVRGGRLECIEARAKFPMRTVHLLTRRVGDPQLRTEMAVTSGLTARGRGANASDVWRGFLIGAGGGTVDYRLSALVHHRPAADGGLLCVVDSAGRAMIRDFAAAPRSGGLWSIGGAVDPADMPELASGEPAQQFNQSPYTLDLLLDPAPDGTVTIALTVISGRRHIVSTAILPGVAPERVRGGVGLVSSRGEHWFRNLEIGGAGVSIDPLRALGPIVSTMYTVSRDGLSLSAQLAPLALNETVTAHLELLDDGIWTRRATGNWNHDARLMHFAVPDWPAEAGGEYRVVVELDDLGRFVRSGIIRPAPVTDEDFVLASLNCNKVYTGGLAWNSTGIWFPHTDLTREVNAHDPDLLYFAGDQIYEGDLTPADRRTDDIALLDYLGKYYRWCWAFRDLTRDRPTISVPDDHDVYHGNIWGAGGRKAARTEVNGRSISAQDSGGYIMSPRFVNAVHATQTSHLPPPIDAAPVAQGISVYFTRLEWGGLSFAILSDRQFKSAPARLVPAGEVVNGWFQAEGFDPARQSDVPGAELLGSRQEAFLEAWAVDFSGGAWMKVVLSQSPFANVATLPRGAKSGGVIPSLPILAPGEIPLDHVPVADCDSGGWPQTARNRALRLMRRGFALHLNGDQHLGSLIQYGVDGWRDSGWSFCAPAIANTWPRRWFPAEPGGRPDRGAPPFTGDYRDGFGNYMTVYAVSNPSRTGRTPARLYDRGPGYGIVRFHRRQRRITMECWPRGVTPDAEGGGQYTGWPRTISQLDGFPPTPRGWLPTLVFDRGAEDQVVQVIEEATGKVIYAIRNQTRRFQPWTSTLSGTFTIRVGDPDRELWNVFEGLVPRSSSEPRGANDAVLSIESPDG